jgi:hypothetical protein
MKQLEKISVIPESEHSGLPEVLSAVTPMAMLNRALASGASMEVMEKLMNLHERWEATQARKAFDNAMSAAKAEIPVIQKNRTVDFTSPKGRTHYRHEDLAEVARTVSPILARNGLSYRFRVTSALNEPVTVTCVVSHRDGHFEETTLSAGRDESGNKNSIQAVGSTLTYLQRMTLKAALGLAASDDDDGKAAGSAETISLEQVEELVALADEVGADKEAFCRYFKVGGFADIPTKEFPRAVAACRKRRFG